MAIPKIIHYCWLGQNQFSDLEKKCIESWKKILPDYEFVLWNDDKIKGLHSAWIDSAIAEKKWAFAADYVRLYALYNYGGIYLDCDVEVLKAFDDLLNLQTFVGWESARPVIAAAVMGSEANLPWLKDCLDWYKNKHFDVTKINKADVVINYIIKQPVLKHGIHVFGCEYFSPLNNLTGKCRITLNTYCIHHFNGTWFTPYQKKYFEIRKNWSKKYGNLVGFIAASLFAVRNKVKPFK